MRTNLLDYLEQGGLRSAPAKTWLVDEHSSYTFGQFAADAQRLAGALIAAGVTPNAAVAVFIPNSAAVLVCDFAALYAGAFYMNMDVRAPRNRSMGVLENVRPAVVLVDDETEALIAGWGLPPERVLHWRRALAGATAPSPAALAAARTQVIDTDPACLINTSGSTGTPKSCVVTHRGLVDYGDWFEATFPFEADDVVGSLSPLYFDGYFTGLLMALLKGATFKIVPAEHGLFPVKLVDFLEHEAVSFIFWVPSSLVQIAAYRLLDARALPRLRFVGFAGEVMPPRTVNYLRSRVPHARFVNFYGPIEISVICTWYEVTREFGEEEPLPIGLACRNTGVLVLTDDDRPVAPGEQGELCVRGSCLSPGYWNDPEKTARAFVQNPLQPHFRDPIYRTGDLVSLDANGVIQYVGRKDFQIKHQGYRIDLAEIEHVAGRLEEVKHCCAVYDREKKRIVLFIEGPAGDLGALRRRLSEWLPKYMLPAAVRWVEQLPRNPNGKVDRVRLAQAARDGG